MQIVVLTHPSREPIILPYMAHYAPDWTLYVNQDWPLPDGAYPFELLNVWQRKDHNLGAYRCFRGHQEALKATPVAPDDCTLVLEDDARPNDDRWLKIAQIASQSIESGEAEVVSLHCREYDPDYYDARMDMRLVRAYGSCAYLIDPKARQRLIDAEWSGMPVDLWLANRTQFLAIVNSPFEHDRQQGSLVENPA